MSKASRLSLSHQGLIRRYLLWAYKTTREGFERIERKTTQLQVDKYLWARLNKNCPSEAGYQVLVEEFKVYIANKKADEIKLKKDPQYLYLQNRLAAIESATKHFLGAKALRAFEALFEAEFTRRILEAKEHH